MRSLGDAYVKDGRQYDRVSCPSVYPRFTATEFHRHREVTNPLHVMGFLTQWKMYLDELPHDPTIQNFKKLDPTVFEKVDFCLCSAAVTIHFLGMSSFRCPRNSWDNYTSSCMHQKMFGNPSKKMDLTWNMANRDEIYSHDFIYV